MVPLADVTLRNGRHVTVRVIQPADKRRLAAAFEQLSPRSRRQRFFAATARLTDEQLRYFTEVNHQGHEAQRAGPVAPRGAAQDCAGDGTISTGRSA